MRQSKKSPFSWNGGFGCDDSIDVGRLAEKRAAVEQMSVCGHGKLAKELGISKRQLYTWRAYVRRLERAARAETSKERALERENLRLKAALGDQGAGSGFFQRCVAQNRGSTPARQRVWRDCVYEEIRVMRPQTHLSVESMCRLAQVSRAGFYRHWQQREPRSEEIELCAEVQRIALTPIAAIMAIGE